MIGGTGARGVHIGKAALTAVLALALLGALASSALAKHHSPSRAYRHGVVPPLLKGHARHGRPVRRGHRAGHARASAAAVSNLTYGGGLNGGGVGVTTGAPKVYLVFWGPRWGSPSVVGGDVRLSGDSKGMAPRLQDFFRGMGTGGETWSNVMTQYCDGIASGTQTCPSAQPHVGYPTGGALGSGYPSGGPAVNGVWVDSSSEPSQASGNALAQEAVRAAGKFGNTTRDSNRNVQYFIVSASGMHPDGFNTWFGNFCAWHSFNGDSSLSGGGAVNSSYGNVAFTNMPYVTDMGSSCGQNFVNSGTAGTLDGATIVGGHEYAETITDQFPAGNPAAGWTDSSGYENGDKCAWISSGQGASTNLSFGASSFAVQSTWSNDTAACETSHVLVSGSSASNPNLSFSDPPMSITAGAAPKTGTLTLSAPAPAGGVTITLSTSSAGGTFGSNTVTIPVNGTTAQFTYADTRAGSPTLTASSPQANGASQTETVSAGPVVKVTVTPSNPTLGTGGTQLFSALAQDYYNNPVNTGTSWTVTGDGNLTSSTSANASFTAGSSPGTATVTATNNSVSSQATVNVTAQAIVNGGFETGSLSGWSPAGITTGVTSSSPHGGGWSALLGSSITPTNGDSQISQTFTAPVGSTKLSLYYAVNCPDTVQYDWATATLRDNTAGTTATVLAKTCVSRGAWTPASASVTAGHTYTLNLISHDDNYQGDPTATQFDDVSVS